MAKIELYAGVLIAGGKVQDLMLYTSLDCCRDTLRDSVRHYQALLDEKAGFFTTPIPKITSAAVYKVVTGTHNEDGYELVEALDPGTLVAVS